MKNVPMPYIICLAMLFATLLTGCQTYDKTILYLTHNPLFNHRSPMVRYPAVTGFYTEAIVGAPLAIPTVPVVAAIHHCADLPARSEGLAELSEAFVASALLGAVGETALGVPCWMLFGWWWPEPPATKSRAPGGYKMKPARSEAETRFNPRDAP